ncbi:MAG: SurA N-terminal domain-containing protein [Edaphobacter sp.]|uniref:SurA N-terminal domain-containing protein n=1 Tax=Edaphobacter sp. TaxID=1934404 RepID=UPI00238A4F68|nr:SurA N-terminal domain-containing protein [Edaphobacter sp.]MDE1177620.1 SurA N-terminal domain-containing protein [Edaphobacter sp.]
MSAAHNPGMRWHGAGLTALLMSSLFAVAQQPVAAPGPSAVPSSPVTAPVHPAVPQQKDQGAVLDSVVAIVNGDVILESDVDEERRFETIQPYRGSATEFSRDLAIQRLINRTLITQQAAVEPGTTTITDADVKKQIQTLRQDIPQCEQYHCETDEGWQKFLAAHGFTVSAFEQRWRSRMELLKLIEVRFRDGIGIDHEEIKEYYEKTMLPEYQRQHVKPPKLDDISARIEEVLLQQRVSTLLRDWLKSLRVQGNVWIMQNGEVAP